MESTEKPKEPKERGGGLCGIAMRGKSAANASIQAMQEFLPIVPAEEATNVSFDRNKAFMLYATFTGDIEKTATALQVNAVDVLRVADEENWAGRLATVLRMKRSKRPAEVERGINRALNFVQAHKMRIALERAVDRLVNMSSDELMKFCFITNEVRHKDGSVSEESKICTRPLADLAAALEKVHLLTYAALNDTAPERAKRLPTEGDEDEIPAVRINEAITEAMKGVQESASPRALLFDAQLAKGRAQAEEAEKQAQAKSARELLESKNLLSPEEQKRLHALSTAAVHI